MIRVDEEYSTYRTWVVCVTNSSIFSRKGKMTIVLTNKGVDAKNQSMSFTGDEMGFAGDISVLDLFGFENLINCSKR